LAYVIEGKGYFCKEKKYFLRNGRYQLFDMKRDPFLENGDMVLFGEGDQVMISTEGEHVRFLLISGKPIFEPVACMTLL